MNIIGARLAVALYPYNTFVERETMVCHTTGTHRDDALRKYQDRGFRVRNRISAYQLGNPSFKSDFKWRTRYIGDRLCWTMVLPPVLDTQGHEVAHQEHLHANSWALTYFGSLEKPRIDYAVSNRNLLKTRFSYVIAPRHKMTFKRICSDLETAGNL